MKGREQLGCLLHMEVRELAEVIVDGVDLIEVGHGNSWVRKKGTEGTKKPRAIRDEQQGAVYLRRIACRFRRAAKSAGSNSTASAT
jgi:hypothetical protein